MTPFVQSLTMTYLLWPLLGLLLVGLGVFIAKKNALLGNKRLIGYFIGAVIVLTVPALFGFMDYDFMPIGYITLACKLNSMVPKAMMEPSGIRTINKSKDS